MGSDKMQNKDDLRICKDKVIKTGLDQDICLPRDPSIEADRSERIK